MNDGTFVRRGVILIALLGMVACQRRVQLVSEEADSTAHFTDSSTVLVRQAQERWEDSGAGEDAAALSARMLAEQLAPLPPATWKGRADALLDSLGIGSETASGPCALAVNFFARSDPGAGSWPYLFWCGEKRPRIQPIDGRKLRLAALTSRGIESNPSAGAPPGVAILFGKRGGGGQQPLLMVWEAAGPERWTLKQTLGADSLGGIGSGEFEAYADTAIDLVARTYRTPRGFVECATCPHVFTVRRFRWRTSGFERLEERPIPSPYSTFVDFVQALMANDSDAAAQHVSDQDLVEQAFQLDWQRSRGPWRIAPATDETPNRMVFFRGDAEAYRVSFVPRNDDWVIAGFEAVPRQIE